MRKILKYLIMSMRKTKYMYLLYTAHSHTKVKVLLIKTNNIYTLHVKG